MWRFYTEDLPGLKVGPVPVLVMSLLFIVSVFMLHSLIDSATSICLSSEEERKKSQHILDQKHSDFLFMRKKFSASLLFYRELNEN